MRKKRSSLSYDIADRLHFAAIHLLRRLRRVDEATGLSAPKLSALSVVVFGGPISLGKLAAAEQVRPPSMTLIVRELEAQGLVRRTTNEEDRRSVTITTTRKGTSLLHKGRSRRVELLSEMIGSLSFKDRQHLEKAAEIIGRILSH